MEALMSWLGVGATCYAVWRAIRLWVGSMVRQQEVRDVMEGRALPPWDESLPVRRAPYDWKNE